MKIIASIATRKGRERSLLTTLRSIRDQVDYIYVHINNPSECKIGGVHGELIDRASTNKKDLTDNGKFSAIPLLREDVYFLTMDDDLWYAPDYVSKMIEAIEKHKCIVTHHGRKLLGTGLHYYRGHQSFRCLAANELEMEIDVCGTGVLGFNTAYFKPIIWNSPDLKMSDLVFSLEAAKMGKKIVVLPHDQGHVQQVARDAGIFGYFATRSINRQNEIADEIFNLKHRV